MTSLRDAWEAEARDWIRFSGEPDVFAWLFNIPAFLSLLPEPGERTLDIGCGEGRVARELIALGHCVQGIDAVPALVEAARAGSPPIDATVADAAELPFDDETFDLAISFMTLQSVDDLDGAIAEAARVLKGSGTFAFAVVHPMNSVGQAPGYFDEHTYAYPHERDGVAITLHDRHRPLAAYFAAIERAGLTVRRLREPVPSAELLAVRPDAERWTRTPCFLHVVATK